MGVVVALLCVALVKLNYVSQNCLLSRVLATLALATGETCARFGRLRGSVVAL